jgi:hypothetical protein
MMAARLVVNAVNDFSPRTHFPKVYRNVAVPFIWWNTEGKTGLVFLESDRVTQHRRHIPEDDILHSPPWKPQILQYEPSLISTQLVSVALLVEVTLTYLT